MSEMDSIGDRIGGAGFWAEESDTDVLRRAICWWAAGAVVAVDEVDEGCGAGGGGWATRWEKDGMKDDGVAGAVD